MDPVPDGILVSLRERLQDWEDFDVAGFYLGKVLGIIPLDRSFGETKYLFYGARGVAEAGGRLHDALVFLADAGILESRENYAEFRWPMVAEGSDGD